MINMIGRIAAQPWLMHPDWMRAVQNIVAREDVTSGITNAAIKAQLEARKEALSANVKEAGDTSFVEYRGSVGVLNITGPIMRYGNGMNLSGPMRSLQAYSEDFKTLENDSSIDTIVLNIDSPGGEASGIAEFASYIRGSKKRVVAYVDDLAASAGYWIAAAADEIVASETALVGSIGVVFSMIDDTEKLKKEGLERVEIVSVVSPKKRPDISSEEGRAQIEAWANKLGRKFVAAVAEYRGVSYETVIERFGGGDLLISDEAKDAGMVDRVGNFEALIEELTKNKGVNTMSQQTKTAEHGGMMTAATLKEQHPELYAGIFEVGATAERERIKAIEAVAVPGFEAIVNEMKFDGKSTAEQVELAMWRAEKEKKAKMEQSWTADGEEVAALVAEAGTSVSDTDGEKPQAEAKTIMAKAIEKLKGAQA
ncbi:S49 family peptidase [Hydrogenimonas sp.]